MTASASRPGSSPHAGRRSGFTLVEILIVMTVVGLLAAIASPSLQRAILKARAADAVSELQLVRTALMSYVTVEHGWPKNSARGQIPSGLEDYLPDGFSFRTEPYTIDYDNLLDKKQGFLGLTVITKDEDLGAALLDMLGSNAWTDGKKRFTWVIEWAD